MIGLGTENFRHPSSGVILATVSIVKFRGGVFQYRMDRLKFRGITCRRIFGYISFTLIFRKVAM